VRILHTADWHLCNRLGRIDRSRDLESRVEAIANLCEEHAADVLLIAGDLFDDRAGLDQMEAAFRHILATFHSFLKRGGSILAVTGNHDRDAKINMIRTGMSLAAPFARDDRGRIAGGRMYLSNGRIVATLADPQGVEVQFVFVPYPFPSRYDLADVEILAKEQLHQALHARVSEWLADLPKKPDFNMALPTVMLAHLHVKGADINKGLYKMTAADDVLMDFADLHTQWAYIALGHIRQPQLVGGAAHIRYPGSLDRLDITEDHEHGAILLDIGPAGLLGEPTFLAIPATPFHRIAIANLDEELPALEAKFPDRETAIVQVEIAPHSSTISRDEATRRLRKIFPRLQDARWIPAEPTEAEPSGPRVHARASLEETVRTYLEQQTDPDMDELKKLAESFLKDGAA